MVSPVPEGYHSVTPYIVVDGAARAIDFYRDAFGAEEVLRLSAGPDKLAHAEIRIGDSIIMLTDEWPDMNMLGPNARGGASGLLMIYVDDADAAFAQAVGAGATIDRPVVDQFYGDRSGSVIDPFGHRWTLATHVEDVAPEEMEQRMRASMSEPQSA
ncbi:MAG: VOC family protein [Sphingomonas sp.]|nr:VOC family protein [Sphingomonas sp.]